MGVATAPPPSLTHSKNHNNSELASGSETCVNSMSQGFHQGIFSFSNGFDRSTISPHHHHHQPPHIAQQSRRDKLRVQGFDPPPPPPPPLVGIEEEVSGELPGYETAGMLSEMFNFPSGTATAADLLENQIATSYRLSRPSPVTNEWYGNRQVGGLGPLGDGKHHHHHHHHQPNSNDRHSNSSSSSIVHQQIPGINADSAAAMHLFLMNPQPRSPSPPHPNPSNTSNPHHVQGFQSAGVAAAAASAFGDNPIHHSQFTWVPGGSAGGDNNSNKIGGVVESQGLSLSLSSLQHLETAKAEELRIGDGGVMYYGLGNGGSTAAAAASYPSMKNLRNHNPPPHHQHPQDIHVGFGSSSLGVVNVLRISKYSKPARELLEEFCSVGRGQFKMKKHSSTSNPNPNQGNGTGTGGAGGSSPSSSKDISPLSSSDRIEYQRRKVKLLSMIDEVDRRYNHYCEQMQMVVNSFDSVMGFGAATPYTALAQKAMSRHFRCLKDAIAAQLKQTCELLGEKDGATASGVTKGETPRLRMLEESLRQQRAFHQMGIMEQEAWRPQRGLPERSVNILRAWLFEHFLHPYPSDTDKHLLARQTGLSRNQRTVRWGEHWMAEGIWVSNWFINARVRLWKPMVEEMYQKEAKEEAEERDGDEREISPLGQSSSSAQTPTPTTATAASATTPVVVPVPPPPTAATTTSSSKTISTTAQGKRSEINAHDNDPSLNAINRQCFGTTTTTTTTFTGDVLQRFPATHVLDDTCRQNGHSGILAAADYGTTAVGTNMGPTLLRFGTTTTTTTTGDVSLTLGLRHAGNLPEQSPFAVRDFGGC